MVSASSNSAGVIVELGVTSPPIVKDLDLVEDRVRQLEPRGSFGGVSRVPWTPLSCDQAAPAIDLALIDPVLDRGLSHLQIDRNLRNLSSRSHERAPAEIGWIEAWHGLNLSVRPNLNN